MRIDAARLTAYVRDVFVREGCSEAEAGRIGRFLVGANLDGHDSHGVIRVPRYVAWLRAGEPERRMRAERLTDGVPPPDPVWETLLAAGRPHGLDGDGYRG